MRYLSHPARLSLAWLYSDRDEERPGVACFLPECSTVVDRQVGSGRPSWFCSSQHRHQFRRRRASLLRALAEIDHALSHAESATVPRARLLADRRYLQSAMLAYPDVAGQRG